MNDESEKKKKKKTTKKKKKGGDEEGKKAEEDNQTMNARFNSLFEKKIKMNCEEQQEVG